MEEYQWIIAAGLAEQHHDGQMYGEYPYIKHLKDVDDLLIKHELFVKDNCEQYVKIPGEFRDMLRACVWLHDIIEDTACTINDLAAAGICQEVIDAVVLLTKTPGYDNVEYLEALITNPLARKTKQWDSFANFNQNLVEKNFERAFKYAHQFWVIRDGKWFEPTTVYKAKE